MSLRRVTIVGVGLIGGSLGLALRRFGLAAEVVGVGYRRETLDRALERGAIDRAVLAVEEGTQGADLVVLAVPVGLMVPMAQAAGEHLAPGAILTDVASTKARIVAELEPLAAARGARFVGGHPLAGSDRRGVDAAREDLFQGAVTVLTPTERSATEAVEAVEALWRAVGSRVVYVSAAEHDRLVAHTSHLPHLTAAALVGAAVQVDHPGADLAHFVASGFRDTTRVASGDPDLWREILLDNRENVLAAIGRLRDRLAAVEQALARGDGPTLRAILAKAKESRDALIGG